MSPAAFRVVRLRCCWPSRNRDGWFLKFFWKRFGRIWTGLIAPTSSQPGLCNGESGGSAPRSKPLLWEVEMITNNPEYDAITSDHGRSVPSQTRLDRRHGSHLCIAADRAYCLQGTKHRPEDIGKPIGTRAGQVRRVAVDMTPNQGKDSMRRPAALLRIALALGAMILAPRAGAQAQGPTHPRQPFIDIRDWGSRAPSGGRMSRQFGFVRCTIALVAFVAAFALFLYLSLIHI